MRASTRKIKLIAANTTNKLISPFSNALLSLIVISHYNTIFWGEFVVLILLINVINKVINWGHRDFLLKEFSTTPSKTFLLWSSNLSARSGLLVLSIVSILLFSPFDIELNLWLSVWLITSFINKAFEVMILFEQRFVKASIYESISALTVISLVLLFIRELTLVNLVILMSIGGLLKNVLFLFSYRHYFSHGTNLKLGITSMSKSFGFFLPAIVGFTQNRIDIYLVALLMSQEALGSYHILLNFLALTHSLITFALGPFIKSLYRINDELVRKIQRLSSLYGMAFCILAVGGIYLITSYYYKLNFAFSIYFLAFVQLIPLPNFQVRIYQLFKAGHQYTVVWITLALGALYILFALLLIPVYQLSGALAANAINQWLSLLVFYLLAKRKLSLLT